MMDSTGRDRIIDRVRQDRLADDLWRLVNTASPTGRERDAAVVYAEMLSDAGATVAVDEQVSSQSPSVIGRLAGTRPGKTFQLAGHLDHIDVPHPDPTRDECVVSGRGSADMKNGLAGILEVIRVLAEGGCDFPGEVLVTAYGLHEAPEGDSAVLSNLIDRRIVGDAALVAESGESPDVVVVAAAGQSIWNATIEWDGQRCHELVRPREADGVVHALESVLAALRGQAAAFGASGGYHPLLRPPSLFVGQVHVGDFYNRTPGVAKLQGTRRWHPDSSFGAVQHEMDALLGALAVPPGIMLETDWVYVGESYELSSNELVVTAVRSACKSVAGSQPRLGGTMIITDAARLVRTGKVPTVTMRFGSERAHADHEYVALERMVAPCQITLLTVLNYLEEAGVDVDQGAESTQDGQRSE